MHILSSTRHVGLQRCQRLCKLRDRYTTRAMTKKRCLKPFSTLPQPIQPSEDPVPNWPHNGPYSSLPKIPVYLAKAISVKQQQSAENSFTNEAPWTAAMPTTPQTARSLRDQIIATIARSQALLLPCHNLHSAYWNELSSLRPGKGAPVREERGKPPVRKPSISRRWKMMFCWKKPNDAITSPAWRRAHC